MQANCPQCGNRILVDDARAPERPFGVRCPKCQATVRFAGRGAAPAVPEPAPAPAAGAAPVQVRPAAAAEPPRQGDEVRAQVMAAARRELGPGDGPARALVALPDRDAAAALALTLTRQGFAVDSFDDAAEGLRRLEQGFYALVAAARLAGAGPHDESLYQRVLRLGPEARRRVFVLLVGDEFRSGDGTQAFAALADLVLHPRDAGQGDALLRAALDERQRLYHVFHDARRRLEAAAGPG